MCPRVRVRRGYVYACVIEVCVCLCLCVVCLVSQLKGITGCVLLLACAVDEEHRYM